MIRHLRERNARGSVSVEVAVLAPAFLALLALAGVSGRTAVADEALASAAHDAARAASISRTYQSAQAAATTAVLNQINWSHLACKSNPQVLLHGIVGGEVHTLQYAFNQPLGTRVSIRASVGCEVTYENLQMWPLTALSPTSTRWATFTSPLDRYRARSGS